MFSNVSNRRGEEQTRNVAKRLKATQWQVLVSVGGGGGRG